MQPITINDVRIGPGERPFIIAELSGNHNQSLARALSIVDAAAAAGADALKLQTYTADTMTLDCDLPDFVVKGTGAAWQDRTLYELYDEAHTPWEWHREIFARCHHHGIVPFSTPFDESAVSFLANLDMPLYKIASFEITDLALIKCIAQTGKPVIMSTGMATADEISCAVDTLKNNGCEQYVLLQCTSAYPAQLSDANLSTIPYLAKQYSCFSGLSDHTLGAIAPVCATALGAHVIEKHFTLDRQDGGVDSHFSLEPDEFAHMVTQVKQAFASIGQVKHTPSQAELPCRNYRRSIYVCTDIQVGETITHENVRIVRPGFGLSPEHIDDVIGRRVKQSISRGSALQWELLEP